MSRPFIHRIFRFAPSSNGYLHLGHAYSAVLNFEMARAAGGRFLLRIEDIDLARCPPIYEEAIYEDLGWLGLSWEKPVRRQSQHFADYAAALSKLSAQGLTYPCFCTRSDILSQVAGRAGWPLDPDGSPLYPGICKHLTKREIGQKISTGQPHAFRIDMQRALAQTGRAVTFHEMGPASAAREVTADPSVWGDATLSRKDIPASYHIAVVVDDALQGVTDVVRGVDLFMATSLHRLLQILLGLPTPAYHHHVLLRDSYGRKLSKSARSRSLRGLRADGLSAEEIRNRLAPDLIAANIP